jgi:UDP-N-acetylglucosamine--N-acetylmuramyl-(pentapeptide) pyrophosphoryl-undecaprenol N-acetylglucosamine transferase
LQKQTDQPDIIFIGQSGGMEADIVRAAGLPFVGVVGGKFRRLPGAGLGRNLLQAGDILRNLRDLVLIAVGTVQCLWVLGRFRPQAVFNKAGPTGLPVGLACRLLGIPMVIHEPDIIPGLSNRILSRWATAIAVGFPAKLYADLPAAKLTYTGNPVQPAILAGERAAAIQQFRLNPKRPVVLVVGGSQGAAPINAAVMTIAPALLELAQIIHVTGAHDYDHMVALADAAAIGPTRGYHAVPYLPIGQMGAAYQAATVVVSRAGASTIAELAAVAKPLVVLPNHLAAAHQVRNAEWLAANTAAVVLPSEDPAALQGALTTLLSSPARQRELAAHLARCNRPDAADHLATLVRTAAERRA